MTSEIRYPRAHAKKYRDALWGTKSLRMTEAQKRADLERFCTKALRLNPDDARRLAEELAP